MAARRRLPGATVPLVGIWTAVGLVGIFGGDIVTETGGKDGTRSRVPAVVPVAALAGAATLFVTWFEYRAETARAAELGGERPAPSPGPAPVQDGPVAVGIA